MSEATEAPEGEADGQELTIDELARRTGMTVRNIRAHQSRGLLPPPTVRGRTGWYGAEHVARIELIREMQGQGFNLEAIRRLVEAAPGSSEEPLRFLRAVAEPYVTEAPELLTAEDLATRWGTRDAALLAKAVKLGLLRPLGDGSFEDVTPRLTAAGRELAELGVPADVALELAARIRKHADGVARGYVRLFVDQVWKPFEEAGAPEERWPEVRDALERLRPLAAESLLSIFGVAMADASEAAFGREIERLRKRRR
ncbi:MerR family transcriptional regulator [Baekduia soli]|uniref:MerR family transcriptional regulator n=1 Tax=Baekduia soli TaxID=496014 RepID=UPI0016522F6C|nr:MerR family transcriptional regulator [Baekduia soli]